MSKTPLDTKLTSFSRNTCRLCEGLDLTNVFCLKPTPPANSFVPAKNLGLKQPTYPLDLYFCNDCKHLQLLLVIQPEILFRNYLYVSGTSKHFVKHFEGYARTCIDKFKLDSNSFVIDIGSNDGTFLSFFKEEGIGVLGIDPASSIAKKATECGIETWPEFFDQKLKRRLRKKAKYIPLITANNVFAHSDNLGALVDFIKLILAPNGVFVFEVSYLGAIYEKTLFDTIYHEHLAYHSVIPLVPFFKNKGMELFSIQRVETHGGSIRGMVKFSEGAHKPDGSVQTLIKYEERLRLNQSKTWISFAMNIMRLKKRLSKLLHMLKHAGYSIAGYGAAAKSTTLLHEFNIDGNIIDFIVDDAHLKQGLLSPGLHIPIKSSDSIYIKNPDYILILAWNFASEIMIKHNKFKAAGGKFIVPLPEVRVY